MEIDRDFNTDYGYCCWYTPQIDLSEVKKHQSENGLDEPEWGYWFSNIKKANLIGFFVFFSSSWFFGLFVFVCN